MKTEQEMDPVPSDCFLEGTGSINVQPSCYLLDFDGLLLFSNGPHCRFHHLSSRATDWCNGID